MAFVRKPSNRIILGIPQLDKRLKELKLAVANRIARGALLKGVRVAVKKIKAQVPSKQKHLRKAIGGYVKKQKGGNKGVVEAKAGAAVGKRLQSIVRRGKVQGRGGVGISAANIHWYILGTKKRTVKKTGQRVGRMPKKPIVKKAFGFFGKGPIWAAVKDGVMDGIERERAKLVAKHALKHGN